MYGLDVTPAYYRHIIRQRFERNRHVTDVRAIDVIIHKSRLDYQETMNVWKMPDQILGILLQRPKDEYRQGRTFLEKFYEGTSWIFD
jgi:NADH dehydrogenase (ubiquinone) 1 alpha subcomplex subunit 6